MLDAARATPRGADVLVPRVGLTTKGSIGGGTAMTLDEAVERVQAMRNAAYAVRPDVLVLCHGGPIAEPDDAAYALSRTEGWRASRCLLGRAAADRAGHHRTAGRLQESGDLMLATPAT
jgi:predicted TIM-barrel enzyme